jgi:hypothetical protein
VIVSMARSVPGLVISGCDENPQCCSVSTLQTTREQQPTSVLVDQNLSFPVNWLARCPSAFFYLFVRSTQSPVFFFFGSLHWICESLCSALLCSALLFSSILFVLGIGGPFGPANTSDSGKRIFWLNERGERLGKARPRRSLEGKEKSKSR